MPNILWLSEIRESNLDSVGKKAVEISRLYQSDFAVPPAFCITKEASKYFLDGEIPISLRREIEEAYENINVDPDIQNVNKSTFSLIKAGRDNAAVVVRVSGDKISGKSTMLNVKGSKNLIQAIINVWSNNPGSALVIQKMASPSISGVISFDDDIVLRSVYGFLDSLEYADTHRLNKRDLSVKNRKKRMQEYKVVMDDMVGSIASKKVFSDDFKMGENELSLAGNVGRGLADEYSNKEIEFAIEGSKLYLLNVKDKEEPKIEEKEDSLPDLITPIPDTLLFKENKTDLKECKEDFVEITLGEIHIKVPKNKKSVEAAYRLLDAISSQLE